MKYRTVAGVAVAAGIASASPAQIPPAGPDFQMDTYTACCQARPALSMAPDGRFVVVWDSDGQDGDRLGVFARRFTRDAAALGPELQVNTTTAGHQYRAAVAVDASGAFVVVWRSADALTGQHGIYGQRFDRAGAPRGSQFRVGTSAPNVFEDHPAVAAGQGGDFVVVWQRDAAGADVFAQRYDAEGAPRGGELRVNGFTAGSQAAPAVAALPAGGFVVAWQSLAQDGDSYGVFARRFDAAGIPAGAEMQVNTFTSGSQVDPALAVDSAGHFVVAWSSLDPDGSGYGVFAQRFDASGARVGAELAVNAGTANDQAQARVSSAFDGSFVVAWESSQAGGGYRAEAQAFDTQGARRGGGFPLSSSTTGEQRVPVVGSDAFGNFVAAWEESGDIDGRRFGGLRPASLVLDTAAGPGDANGVWEPGETVDLRPAWSNFGVAPVILDGVLAYIDGPAGATYTVTDARGSYGTILAPSTQACAECYAVAVSNPPVRPALHWDARTLETLAPSPQSGPWALHVGASFTDVGRASPFYRHVETLLHRGVTAGCTPSAYCPAAATTREQMAVYVLRSGEGPDFVPAACVSAPFTDVPAASPFCRWIRELAARGIVSGCGGGSYCPTAPVTREQMALFVLRTLDPALTPPACGAPIFGDVPASSPFCRWIEELFRRGVVTGCGGGNYCPDQPVTREQMGVFLTVTFGLTLYGP